MLLALMPPPPRAPPAAPLHTLPNTPTAAPTLGSCTIQVKLSRSCSLRVQGSQGWGCHSSAPGLQPGEIARHAGHPHSLEAGPCAIYLTSLAQYSSPSRTPSPAALWAAYKRRWPVTERPAYRVLAYLNILTCMTESTRAVHPVHPLKAFWIDVEDLQRVVTSSEPG